MIEAINASISTAAPVMRAIAEEVSTSQTANPVRVQKAAIAAPYLSPHVRLAPDTKPIFVVRDVETGAQLKQFPTEAQIRAYQKAGQARSQVQTQTTDGEAKMITPEQAKMMIETSVQYKEERAAVKYDAEVSIPGAKSETSETQAAPAAVNQQA